MSKIAILIGCYVTNSNEWARPPLTLFFDKFFESIHTSHQYRIILSDDGSIPSVRNEIIKIAERYNTIETHFRDKNIGECKNLESMCRWLGDEQYILYVSNDCFIRNLDNRDWLDIMIEILDNNECTAATIQAGYPTEHEYSWQPFGKYQKFGFLSTRHFMMKRECFDNINWAELINLVEHDNFAGSGSWEAWLNNRLTPVTTLGYSDSRLGMWHVGCYVLEKITKICNTEEALRHDAT